jgi:cyclically-permuted mutarotase family protein
MQFLISKKILYTFLLLQFMLMTPDEKLYSQEASNHISWSATLKLPAPAGMEKQIGVAGPFAGVSNNVLLVAGGANFPNGLPWEGGNKVYHDEVYVLQKEGDQKFTWLKTMPLHLKNKLAYGASVTTTDGVVCIGGETETGGHSKEVFLLKWDVEKKNIVIEFLPELPVGLANAAATRIGHTIYVVGGEDAKKALNTFFQLDMSAKTMQWKTLPNLPIAMSHSAAVAQFNGTHRCVYVIGGRSKTDSGISDLHNTVFCYDPIKNSWQEKSKISDGKNSTNMSAANGVALSANYILLVAGDKGNLFHQIETYNARIAAAKNEEEKQKIQSEKLQLLNNHPGFSKDVLLYNTVTDSWTKAEELPVFGPVTTTAVKWDDRIFIPSGEIKPGTRTPVVLVGRLPR